MKKALRFVFGLFMATVFFGRAVAAVGEPRGKNKEVCSFLWEMVQSGTKHMEVLGSGVGVLRRIDRVRIARDVFISNKLAYGVMKIYYDNGMSRTVLLMTQAENGKMKSYVCDFSMATMIHFLRHKDNPAEGRQFLFMDEEEYMVNPDISSEMGSGIRICKKEYFDEIGKIMKSVDL